LKFIIFLVATMAGGVAAPSMLLADIFKYVDKDGVIHFSNVPSTEGKWILVIKEKRVHFNLGTNFEKYNPEIWKASQRYSVDYNLVKAVISWSSRKNGSISTWERILRNTIRKSGKPPKGTV